jgi:hypothetical protein
MRVFDNSKNWLVKQALIHIRYYAIMYFSILTQKNPPIKAGLIAY